MNIKKEIIIDQFLESNNMDYLFCILADKEANRLSFLPDSVKKTFDEKITTMALKHTAQNNIPDYIVEEYEPPAKEIILEDDDDDDDDIDEYVEETKETANSPFTGVYEDDDKETKKKKKTTKEKK